MGRTADTKTRILDLAERLARHRGFHGFSYRDVAEPLGIRNAAVHYHFPSKSDLGVALIRRYRDLLSSRTRRFMRDGGDPLPHLEALFALYMQDMRDQRMCPITMVAADYYALPEPMLTEGRLLVAETLLWLTRVLEVGRQKGILCLDAEPGDKAVAILAALQGAVLIARLGSEDALQVTIAEIRRDLGMPATVPAGSAASAER